MTRRVARAATITSSPEAARAEQRSEIGPVT
jgi:hypothetical protein